MRSGLVRVRVVLLVMLSAAAAQPPIQTKGDLPDAPRAQTNTTSASQPTQSKIEILARRSIFFPDIAATRGPLTSAQKFKLFASDSISPSAVVSSTLGAGLGQARDSFPGYGQGAEGFGKRFGASMATRATKKLVGTYALPSLFHQDPRYFVLGNSSIAETLKYSLSRIAVTRTDSGGEAFNWGGIFGPLAAEGVANTYLPSRERTAGKTFQRYGTDLAIGAAGNLVREFWPAIFQNLKRSKFTAGLPLPAPAAAVPADAPAPVTGEAPQFGGNYEELSEGQRRLVDDWVARYNQRTGRTLTPESAYDGAPVSPRTTFEAVTHALATTRLTSSKGEPMGTALDLVDWVETVKGRIPGARGDLQFRMYAVMKPSALAALIECKEFKRDSDNSIFHHGYPLNWRQGGGFPSIQISMAPDGRRADIDVDYRNSGFPAGLFNGHLTAENSDVRAGNNYGDHVKRWNGLANWWRNLFGLPIEHDGGFVPDPERDIPAHPRLSAKAGLPLAVNDFLTSWLVERRPNLAVAYMSPRAFACINPVPGDAGGKVPIQLWNDLEVTNFLLGRPATLQDAIEPVEATDTALVPLSHAQASAFDLVKVPDDLAAQLDCSGAANKHGGYFGSLFRVKAKGGRGAAMFLVWQQEQGYWKIVTMQIDPGEVKDGPVPDDTETAAMPEQPKVEMQADPAMVRSAREFMSALFVKKDADAAFTYFAPSAYACVNLALAPGEAAASSLQEGADDLRRDLRQIARRSPASPQLEDVVESFDPGDPALREIAHGNQSAYRLAGVADSEAAKFMCGAKPAKNAAALPEADGPLTYGTYFGTFLKIREPGDDPAGLGLLWAKDKESGDWKIIAYRIDEP